MAVYFDNAATSWPKPEAVYNEVLRVMREVGANPGRSAHQLAQEAGRIVFEAREAVARFFNIENSQDVFFTSSATESLNLAIKGILKPGDEVIISALEHNSVRRPLYSLRSSGVKIITVGCDSVGRIDLADLANAVTSKTALIAVTGASNVIGTITPLKEVAAIARRHKIPLLVDGAQVCGVIDMDVEEIGIDMLAGSGHKGLLGPMGTGFLYVRPGLEIKPLQEGGTGSNSESDDQPLVRPDRYESGTLNHPGLAGLMAGIEYLEEIGLTELREKEIELVRNLMNGLTAFERITVYGSPNPDERVAVVSFNIEGLDAAEVGQALDEKYDIMSRVGLHCAPSAHRVIGTFPAGTIRFSLGPLNTEAEIDYALGCLKKIVED